MLSKCTTLDLILSKRFSMRHSRACFGEDGKERVWWIHIREGIVSNQYIISQKDRKGWKKLNSLKTTATHFQYFL